MFIRIQNKLVNLSNPNITGIEKFPSRYGCGGGDIYIYYSARLSDDSIMGFSDRFVFGRTEEFESAYNEIAESVLALNK